MASLTRNDFMRLLGVAMASLLLTRCGVFDGREQTPRERLRRYWLQFDELAKKTRAAQSSEDDFGQQLVAGHRAGLDELVTSGELTASVADLVQEAYGAAIYHVWRSNAPITCYEPMMVDYAPTGANTLIQQSQVLDEIARQGTVDPATLAAAQAAIEHDMAFYALTDDETQALYQQLITAQQAAQGPFPSFDQLQLELTPQARQAAQFIVELLSSK
jgi:hypothetical protein